MKQAGVDQRNKVFIEPGRQFRMVSRLSALPLLTLLGATVAVALLGSRVLNETRSLDAEITSLFPLFLALVLLILSAGCLVALQAIRYSHRVVGPSFRLQQALVRIQQGDRDFRVNLRDGDELHELAEEINSLLIWLEANPPVADDLDDGLPLILEDREEITANFASTSD